MLITVNGLVTRSYPSGDHDRLLHIMTEDRGRLSVMVKGGNSKRGGATSACTQLFTYGNYELYSGNNGDLYWLRGGSVLTSFYKLSEDLARMSLASYLCDVASDLTDKNVAVEETAELLRMLLNSLYTLDRGTKPAALVKGVFELRAAAMMGYRPNLIGCDVCGTGYPDEAYLDVMNGLFVCADCQAKRNRLVGRVWEREREEEMGERSIVCPLSASTLAAVRYALAAPESKIFSFALLDDETAGSFERVAETYLLNHLERDFETLRFYRAVVESK